MFAECAFSICSAVHLRGTLPAGLHLETDTSCCFKMQT